MDNKKRNTPDLAVVGGDEEEDRESEILRGPITRGASALQPEISRGDMDSNNITGDNTANDNTNNRGDTNNEPGNPGDVTVPGSSALEDDDEDMGSVFSSTLSEEQAASTPRNKTKDHWEDETLPEEDGGKPRSKRSGRTAAAGERGGVRKKRRASLAQRQRRAREKQ